MQCMRRKNNKTHLLNIVDDLKKQQYSELVKLITENNLNIAIPENRNHKDFNQHHQNKFR